MTIEYREEHTTTRVPEVVTCNQCGKVHPIDEHGTVGSFRCLSVCAYRGRW